MTHPTTMLDLLFRAETALPELLADAWGWETLYVDYEKPHVERLWRRWEGRRLYLHRIMPCAPGEALFHPHPWPSAMRIKRGRYEMGLGHGPGMVRPPVDEVRIVEAGDAYAMEDPDEWHWVRPLDGRPTDSVMLAGTPWNRPSPKPDKPQRPLDDRTADRLLMDFRGHYPR